MAASVPVPIAIPRSAWTSAAASLTPSPTIATDSPDSCRPRHLAGLSAGSTPATTVVDAELLGDVAGRGLVVAGQQHRPQPEPRAASRSRSALSGLTVSPTAITARGSSSTRTRTAVRPLAPSASGRPLPRQVRPGASAGLGGARPTSHRRPVDACRADARCRATLGTPRPVAAADRRTCAIARGHRVLAGRLERARPAGRASASPADLVDPHPPGGQGAGLVEHDGGDGTGGLQHLGPADHDAELGGPPGARRAARSASPGRARTGRRSPARRRRP